MEAESDSETSTQVICGKSENWGELTVLGNLTVYGRLHIDSYAKLWVSRGVHVVLRGDFILEEKAMVLFSENTELEGNLNFNGTRVFGNEENNVSFSRLIVLNHNAQTSCNQIKVFKILGNAKYTAVGPFYTVFFYHFKVALKTRSVRANFLLTFGTSSKA